VIDVDEDELVDEEDDDDPPAQPSGPRKRRVNAIMRRAFDDLDANIYAGKRARRHRRQRFVRAMRKLAGLCASCGTKLDPTDGVTCARCLHVDSAYKRTSTEVEAKAKWVDEFGRPMLLKFQPRMLPIYGERYDGGSPEWPKCSRLADCLTEIVRACGAKDPPGASCPRDCKERVQTATAS
jgi:hypothetical protein